MNNTAITYLFFEIFERCYLALIPVPTPDIVFCDRYLETQVYMLRSLHAQ